MKELIKKFGQDLIEAGVGAAVAAVLALNLNEVSAKTVIYVALAGALTGVLAAARRALAASQPK